MGIFTKSKSKEELKKISNLLGYSKTKKKFNNKNNYDLKIFDSATELWNAISSKQEKHPLSRLLAGYTHDWVSQNDLELFDFNLDKGKFRMKWNKKVDYSYINDPTQHDHVGCIHTIQGVDMAKKLIRNTYKVLLTRAIHGTYIFCEDKELNEYMKTLII